MPSLIGELIRGRFRIVEEIGNGATSVVYRAFDEHDEKPVAIKILDEAIIGSRAPEAISAQRRFDREARIILSLEDSGVTPRFIRAALTNAPWFIAMELVEGRSLRELLNEHERGLPAPLAIALFASIAEGLEIIHSARVLHRDLAPDNISVLVDEDDEIAVRFLDFGIGRPLEAELDPVTKTTTIAGTPQYLAPEQTRGLEIDEAADIYALGCLGYELIAGRPPIRVRSIAELPRVRREIPEPILSHSGVSWVPLELAHFIDTCLEKDPLARPQLREITDHTVELKRQPEWLRSGTELLARAPDPSHSQVPQFEPDQNFGEWRLLEELDVRADCVTWCALERKSNEQRALVVFEDDPRRELSRLESGLAMKERPVLDLSVATLDSQIVDGHVVWEQEFREGRTLAATLASAPELEGNRIIQICSGLAEALLQIHRVDTLTSHGFLASSQVLLDEFDTVHLLNAGRPWDLMSLSPVVEDPGDAPFLAPERHLGAASSQVSDIYSFGAVLFHLLAGCPPFAGPPMAVAWSQHNAPTPDPFFERSQPELAKLRQFARACLSADMTERPRPGDPFARGLDRALAGS